MKIKRLISQTVDGRKCHNKRWMEQKHIQRVYLPTPRVHRLLGEPWDTEQFRHVCLPVLVSGCLFWNSSNTQVESLSLLTDLKSTEFYFKGECSMMHCILTTGSFILFVTLSGALWHIWPLKARHVFGWQRRWVDSSELRLLNFLLVW